jgi:hypothetical protein
VGSNTFICTAKGADASKAFAVARANALHEYGHRGYTGSIAEKRDYQVIPLPDNTDPRGYAERLIEEDDPRISDKWGPAGCVRLSADEWLFFGWASS